MKIDLHTHILPKEWPNFKKKYGYGGWLEIRHDSDKAMLYKDNGDFFRKVDKNCWDANTRLSEMAKTGTDVQVLSTVPVMFNYWAKREDCMDVCRFLNEDMANVISYHPDKFVGLGTIPLQDPELCVEELKRIKNLKGMVGVEIGTHVGNYDFDSDVFNPVFRTCQELELSVFVHPWDMSVEGRYSKFWLPWLVGMPTETSTSILCLLMGGVLLKYPRLKICFAHGGGSFPYLLGRMEHGYNVRPDLCATKCSYSPSTFLGKFYTDSLVHNEESQDLLLKIIGEDKICMGSDYPFPLGEQYPGSLIERSPLSSEVKGKLLAKNAIEFLNKPDSIMR